VNVPLWLPPIRAIRRIKRSLGVPFAMEIIMIMIWTERNSWLFNSKDPTMQSWKIKFKQEFSLVIHKAKEQHKDDMKSWLNNM
jgi:hypothetical protein